MRVSRRHALDESRKPVVCVRIYTNATSIRRISRGRIMSIYDILRCTTVFRLRIVGWMVRVVFALLGRSAGLPALPSRKMDE